MKQLLKHTDQLSFPDIKNALNNISKGSAVVTSDEVARNIALACKRCYPSVIVSKIELQTNSSTDTCSKIKSLLLVHLINKNIRDLKTAFSIDYILIKSFRLSDSYWMTVMQLNL